MKILYLLKSNPDESTKKIMDTQSEGNEVVIIDVRTEKDYERIVDEIVNSDKVISW